MKKSVLTVMAFLGFAQSFAQNIPFEKLDSLSTIISQWQKQTEGKTYKDLNDGVFELSFPQDNFKVWSYNRLASHAVYKKQGDKEVLALTENIDFSKATGISVAENYNGLTFIQVDFPKGHLKTQTIENGSVTNTLNSDHLEFFCKYGTVDADKIFLFDKMFDQLFFLASQLKVEKGLEQEDYWRNEWNDWSAISAEEFLLKYPKSMLVAQARKNKEDHDRAMSKAQTWLDNFCKEYHFVPGSTPEAIAASDKNLAKAIRASSQDYKENGLMLKHYSDLLVRRQFYDGVYINFTSDSKLYSIMYQSVWSPNRAFYNQLVANIKQNLPSELLVSDENTRSYTVLAPNKKYKVQLFIGKAPALIFTVLSPD